MEVKYKELRNIYNYYIAIIGILEYSKNRANDELRRNNTDFLINAIKFPFVDEVTKNKQTSIENRFKEILDFIKNATILSLVAEFENLIFKKIGNTSEAIKAFIDEGYVSPQPMHVFKKSFVKETDDIRNLNGFKSFFYEHSLHGKEFDDLKNIFDYRDYLAHGKRDEVGNLSNKTIEQIVEKLDTILSLCET